MSEAQQPVDFPSPDLALTLLAKAVALQQAGILPLNHDIAWCLEAARTQLTLEGLLKGY